MDIKDAHKDADAPDYGAGVESECRGDRNLGEHGDRAVGGTDNREGVARGHTFRIPEEECDCKRKQP
jgi:hypothetical protein